MLPFVDGHWFPMSRSLALAISRASAFPTQVGARAYKVARGGKRRRISREGWGRLRMVGHGDQWRGGNLAGQTSLVSRPTITDLVGVNERRQRTESAVDSDLAVVGNF